MNRTGPGGAEDPPKDARAAGSIIKDVLIWLGWMLAALVGLAVLVLLPGWFGS